MLLKHTGENEFIKQYSKKIFNFVEEKSAGEQTIEILKNVIMYIYQTFNLGEKDVQQIINDVPEEAGNKMASTYDILIARGKEEGRKEGKEEGKEEGRKEGKKEGIQIGASISKQETEIRKDVELIVKLLQKFPDWQDQQIAEFTERPPEFIKKTQQYFNQKKENKLKTFARELFKGIPNITENNLLEGEKWMLELWNNFKQKKSK